MKTSRAIINERSDKKKSSFHKICTYEHPEPYFESGELQGYAFSHIKTPPQQLVYHKEEVRLTPISLPTPPASPEFWGTSLQKWYQKKPLFTLTAKGQVKRIEKYLEIQKTIEMCKKEYEFQKYTENMKKAYLDFEFRERQPLLYEDKDVCCVCPCNSSRRHDVDFIPVDHLSCSSPNAKLCLCPDVEEEIYEQNERSYLATLDGDDGDPNNYVEDKYVVYEEIPMFGKSGELIEEERIIPTKIITEGEKDSSDRAIYKIIMKNKQPHTLRTRYMMKLNDFERDQVVECNNNESPRTHRENNHCSSGLSRLYVGSNAALPFDKKKKGCRHEYGYASNKIPSICQCCHPKKNFESYMLQEVRNDINDNEVLH